MVGCVWVNIGGWGFGFIGCFWWFDLIGWWYFDSLGLLDSGWYVFTLLVLRYWTVLGCC